MSDTNKPRDVVTKEVETGVETPVVSGARATENVARQAAEAIPQHLRGLVGGQVVAGSGRSLYAPVEVTQRGTLGGAEALRRASETANETVRRTMQAVADGQRQIAQVAPSRIEGLRLVSETANETVRQTTQVVAGGQRHAAQDTQGGFEAPRPASETANETARGIMQAVGECQRQVFQGTQGWFEALCFASEIANEIVRRTMEVLANGQRQTAEDAARLQPQSAPHVKLWVMEPTGMRPSGDDKQRNPAVIRSAANDEEGHQSATIGSDWTTEIEAGIEALDVRADEMLAVAQRAAKIAHERGDEIDAMLAKIRAIRADMAAA